MQFDRFLCKVEPQACTWDLPNISRPVERLKQVLQVRGEDAVDIAHDACKLSAGYDQDLSQMHKVLIAAVGGLTLLSGVLIATVMVETQKKDM
jgi:hypothetical protein